MVLSGAAASGAAAQGLRATLGARAIAGVFRASPVPGGGGRTDLTLTQPAVVLHAAAPRWRLALVATLNLEGLTMPGGELAPGDWGEGFVDRRHPHTYAHELLLTAGDLLSPRWAAGSLSLSAGKGFAPFGTDDPMSRPFVRFPVNHHLAQILERAVAIAAWRAGPVGLEGGLLNGDEPERPGQWPRIGGRFGDSWAARLTLRPAAGLEVQGSTARVSSPEHRPGAGLEQRKHDVSARFAGPLLGGDGYLLGEWARSAEANGAFHFASLLGEAAWSRGPHRLAYRFERTTRPEEERLTDLFRSERPHLDNAVFGVTRWSVHTLGYGVAVPVRALAARVEPLIEVSTGTARRVVGLVDPAALYGRNRFWSFTAGIRVSVGAPMHRMGRYGAALPAGMRPGHAHGEVM